MAEHRDLSFLGYPKYCISDRGTVWAWRSHDVPGKGRQWRWRKIKPLGGRYLAVSLCAGGKVKNWPIHRLVLLAFHGPCPPGMQARHFPDRDTHNNRADNLSWATPGVNQRDRVHHGTDIRGEKHPLASISNDEADCIRWLYGLGLHTQTEVGRLFGIPQASVSSIALGKKYCGHAKRN